MRDMTKNGERGRPRYPLTDAQIQERRKEQSSRYNSAQGEAFRELKKKYPGVFRRLRDDALERIIAERGPLPHEDLL